MSPAGLPSRRIIWLIFTFHVGSPFQEGRYWCQVYFRWVQGFIDRSKLQERGLVDPSRPVLACLGLSWPSLSTSMNPYLKRPMMFSDNWQFLYILFEFELSFFFNSGFDNHQPRFITGHPRCNHVIGIAKSAVKKIMWVVKVIVQSNCWLLACWLPDNFFLTLESSSIYLKLTDAFHLQFAAFNLSATFW